MKNQPDDKLDHLLRSRQVEPASSDLAQRIIFEARRRPQNRGGSLWQWMRQICAEFHLPKPAYVLSGALILGMMIGFSLPTDPEPNAESGSAGIQSIFSNDEALL